MISSAILNVLEFLGKQPGALLYEQGLIDGLQQFLMELGKGFAFVARQKRLQVEGDDFFVELVFYNYLLSGHGTNRRYSLILPVAE